MPQHIGSSEFDGSLALQLGDDAVPDYGAYQRVIVAFSGGKDSLACVLHLLETGCEASRIETWHHAVDGEEGSRLMDWRITPAYCRAVAAALGIPIYFSWRRGGFEAEMLRDQASTQPVLFEYPGPDGTIQVGQAGGNSESKGTRLQFPQLSPNLAQRWCSAYLKIDPAARAIVNQPRFRNSRTLFITGERAEESAGRAKYAVHEPHRADRREGRLQRWVDQWRPVHSWTTAEVWEIIGRHKIVPHPCYTLGWGRCSCAACIFGNSAQWSSLRAVDPEKFRTIEAYESRFGKTIDRKLTVAAKADLGCPYPATNQPEAVAMALASEWTWPIFDDAWELPAGARAELDGPC